MPRCGTVVRDVEFIDDVTVLQQEASGLTPGACAGAARGPSDRLERVRFHRESLGAVGLSAAGPAGHVRAEDLDIEFDEQRRDSRRVRLSGDALVAGKRRVSPDRRSSSTAPRRRRPPGT